MFHYFVYKRHGSISIMLSFMLIAILSLSSTLMETARYKSTQRLLNELEQNAAFSLLGCYDRDLYENFGLLAIEQKAGSEELLSYLNQNLNGVGSGMDLNGLDMLLTIEGVEVDKLYDLTQNEVLRAQIMEFSAYRAPTTLASNLLNFDDLMEELTDQLKEVLPFYETLLKLAGCMEKILDTFTKLQELIEATEKFQKDIESYQEAVGEFNDAIDARNNYKENHTTDEEGYADKLAELNNTISDCASTLQGAIETAKSSMADYYDKYTEFKDTYTSMLSAEVSTLVSAANNDADSISDENIKKNTKKILKDFKSGYEASENMCSKVVNEIDKSYKDFQKTTQEKLTAQYKELEKKPEELSTVNKVETLSGEAEKIIIIGIVLAQVQVFTEMVTGWTNAISKISDIVKVMKIIQTNGMYELDYNNVIDDNTWNSLPSRPNGTLKEVSNPYAAEDEEMVSNQLADTAEVAASLDYDIKFLEPGAGPVDEGALQNAMKKTKEAAEAFQDKCEQLKTAQNIFTILSTLIGIIGTLINFLMCVINLINTFIMCVTSNFSRMLYQKMWEAVYANEMFSNRTTDVGDDERLNGSSFPDNSSLLLGVEGDCFDMANAEYILIGTRYETVNQISAFMLILAMRILCNIPAILSDEILTELVEELCAIPIVGWIAAIIIICAMVFLEAWADMIFMIYTDDGVDVIKTQGYFTLDGSGMDDLVEKVDELLDSIDLEEDDGEEEENEDNILDDYVDSLTKWNYKDHMQVMMLLFVSNKHLNARCADLIEMQMRQIKQMKGEINTFHLSEMATYARVHVKARYKPVLPIPTIPGLNDQGLSMETIHYSGY